MHFNLDRGEIEAVRSLTKTEKSIDRIYNLELKSRSGVTHALIEKTLYISKKREEIK